jgi:hypothetical protein
MSGILSYASFMVKNRLIDANLNQTKDSKFSLDIDKMLVSCSFAEEICSVEDFHMIYDEFVGFCYLFNSGLARNGSTIPRINTYKSDIT